MKKTHLLFLMLLTPLLVQAQNKVSISGTITNSLNSQPARHHPVFLKSVTSQAGAFFYENSVYTNSLGFFCDTFETSYEKGTIQVYVFDCKNKMDSVNIDFDMNSLNHTCNFTLCDSGIFFTTCDAQFTYLVDTSGTGMVTFNGMALGGGNFSYQWSFGDGGTATLLNVQHTYPSDSIYLVKFKISSGYCTDSVQHYVNIQDNSACQAQFAYEVDNLTATFYSMTYGSQNLIEWDFGDGTYSTLEDPSHGYAAPGFYEVCLHVYNSQNTCTDTYCMPIEVGTLPAYDYCGQVFGEIYPIQEGIAHAYRKVGYNYYYAGSSHFSVNGYYWFHEIPAASYIVFIEPVLSAEVLCPSYNVNAVRWQNANITSLTHNVYDADVYLSPIPDPVGPCSLSGNIVAGPEYIPQFGSPYNHNLIYLFDQNWQPVNYTYTHENGAFSFTGVNYGTFYLTSENTGYNSDIITVTLSPNMPVITGLQLNIQLPQAVEEIEDAVTFSGSVYPNPVTDHANLNLEIQTEGNYTFRILNITGATLSERTENLFPGSHSLSFDTRELSAGVYMIAVNSEKSVRLKTLRFVK